MSKINQRSCKCWSTAQHIPKQPWCTIYDPCDRTTGGHRAQQPCRPRDHRIIRARMQESITVRGDFWKHCEPISVEGTAVSLPPTDSRTLFQGLSYQLSWIRTDLHQFFRLKLRINLVDQALVALLFCVRQSPRHWSYKNVQDGSFLSGDGKSQADSINALSSVPW